MPPRQARAPRSTGALSSHGDLGFAVSAQVPGPAAGATIKGRGLRAEGLRQLLHAELAPGRMAGPPGRRGGLGGLSSRVATGGGPELAAGDPGLVVARWGKASGGRVARRGPGAGVEQRRQVLVGPRGPRREGQRGSFRCGETLVEVLWGGFCRDSEGAGSEVRPGGRARTGGPGRGLEATGCIGTTQKLAEVGRSAAPQGWELWNWNRDPSPVT